MRSKDVKELFEEFNKTIKSKQSYHESQMTVFEGKLTARTLGIALDAALESRIESHIDWARTAVRNVAARQNWDAFKNDKIGHTKLLIRSNALPVIESAINHTLIGSTSAVSVLPRATDKQLLPVYTAYTGAEYTGIFDSRGGGLKYGMVVDKKDQNGKAKTFLLFTPGVVFKLDNEGNVLMHLEMPTDRVLLQPFVHSQDLAYKPFGESLLNRSANSAIKSALVINMLLKASQEHRVGNIHMLILDKAFGDGIIGESEYSKLTTEMGTINTVATSADAKLVQMAGIPLDELLKLKDFAAVDFSVATSMSATLFGVQPSNGSFSEGALEAQNRPYNSILDSSRDSYGRAIKNLAISGMSLLTPYDSDWEDIESVWQEIASTSIFGSVGDLYMKIKQSDPNIDLEDFRRKYLGLSIRDQAMAVTLPKFTASAELAEKYRELEESNISDYKASAPTPFDIHSRWR